MKTLITVSALALISNMAMAETFQYEEQLASPDLDPNIESLQVKVDDPQPSVQGAEISLHDFYQGNPDVGHDVFQHTGEVSENHTFDRTSYDAWVRGNPDVDINA